MSLLVQLKFQPVTKYVRSYDTVLNYTRVQVHSRYELNACQDTRISFISNSTSNAYQVDYNRVLLFSMGGLYVINLQCAREHVANISMFVRCACNCTRVHS